MTIHALFLIAAISFPSIALAELSPPQIIALLPPGSYDVLERENQLDSLCPQTTVSDRESCRREQLKPKEWKLNVRNSPTSASTKLGDLQVLVTPGKGIVATFVEIGGNSIKVPCDSSNTDWGYGDFFEFTVSDIKGDWIQLPKRPFDSPVWINPKLDWGEKGFPRPSKLETGNVYTSALGDIVILRFEGKHIRYRAEMRSDMACGEETPKHAERKPAILSSPVRKLYDGDGHLNAWIKYARGC